ncbi:uncharacterized protein LOC117341926 [Pecten maximus]|uniref:uncharacterized protein LOC117341926 n=1 Tax=Pecten maximus TaxID=6579 RepID=UPI001458861C|nr:uncharacterized protein LOC117341926 [Pecten maximus]
MNTADFEIVGTGKTDKGIIIQSDSSELIITGLSSAYNSGDMFLVRDATQIGTAYGVLTHCDKTYVCQFAVISLENDTIIVITFPGYYSASFTFEGINYGPGDAMTITLQESQTFQIQSTSDLSGVKLLSTNKKRFSVLSGSALTNVKPSFARDHIADIVPPITAWEKEYILVRRNLVEYLYDQVKLLAGGRGANVSIIGCGYVVDQRILGYQTYIYNMTCERVHFISDEAVLIAHFPLGVRHGDPAMFFPTPLHYHVREYSVYIPPGFENCALALVMETIHSNSFNLSRISSSHTLWTEISQSKYSTAWLNNLNSGIVEIRHTSSFGGHLICEMEWSMIALTIGIGNLHETLRKPQEYSTTTIAGSSTTRGNYIYFLTE